jgi:hypothetical protein
MIIDIVHETLLWCFVINMGILLWWWLFLTFAHNWVYQVHGKWFKISVEKFDTIHYTGILFFKLGIFFFNLVPYLALLIVR